MPVFNNVEQQAKEPEQLGIKPESGKGINFFREHNERMDKAYLQGVRKGEKTA